MRKCKESGERGEGETIAQTPRVCLHYLHHHASVVERRQSFFRCPHRASLACAQSRSATAATRSPSFLSPRQRSARSLSRRPGTKRSPSRQRKKGTPHKGVCPFSGGEGETRTLAPGLVRPTPLAGAPRHQLEYFSIHQAQACRLQNLHMLLYRIARNLSSPFWKIDK